MMTNSKSIEPLLVQANAAKRSILLINHVEKQIILRELAAALVEREADILRENKKDLDRMDPKDAKYDRLKLTAERIQGLADSLVVVAGLEDPTGQVLSRKYLANGLQIDRMTVPLGVVGVIYEARPNVTIDVAALCIQSGNVCLLKGGSDAWYSNSCLVAIIRGILKEHQLNEDIVQLLPPERDSVLELLTASSYVDIIIPRGSQGLIDYVRQHATVPVIETGAGVCHTYVDKSADLDKAAQIVANAKISRPSVCNALDTILVDREVAEGLVSRLAPLLEAADVTVRADDASFAHWQRHGLTRLEKATPADYGREFLDLICSVKVINGLEEALTHIERHSSKHSECIVSQDSKNIATFMQLVDAAAVYSNASTRFTDGGEFGLGAEIGISTQKLHARGPFALEKLVTEKWFVTGDGQIR